LTICHWLESSPSPSSPSSPPPLLLPLPAKLINNSGTAENDLPLEAGGPQMCQLWT
jgi:hypothetical protein